MIKCELLALFYNKRKLFVIGMFIAIICFDAYLVYRNSFLYEYNLHPVYDLKMVYENTYTPSSAAFLSGASKGHIPQQIIIWLLPLYFLFISSDFHLREVKYNNYQLLQIREKTNKIYICKLISSFLIGFCVAFIGVLINYIICLIVFRNGLVQKISTDGLTFLSSNNPRLTYVFYMIIFSCISGLVSSSMTALCFVVPLKIPVYTASFGVWYFMISGKYSITYLIQPFIEYGLSYMIPSFLMFMCVVIIIMMIGYLKIKRL